MWDAVRRLFQIPRCTADNTAFGRLQRPTRKNVLSGKSYDSWGALGSCALRA